MPPIHPVRPVPSHQARAASSRRAPAAHLAVLVAAVCLLACVGPVHHAPGPAGALFVASGLRGTVQRLDPVTGNALGPPIPVPGSPQHLAPAPGGGVVVLSMTVERTCLLSHLAAPGVAGRSWTSQPLLPPLALAPCTQVLVAGDGQRYAVAAAPAARGPSDAPAATAQQSTRSCRLFVFDLVGPALATLAARPAVRELAPCPPGAVVTAVAAVAGPDGAVLYVGLWRRPTPARPVGRGTVLAVDPATGTVLSRTEVTGAPERLVPASAPGGAGRRLYAVEGTPGPDERNPGLVGQPLTRWRVLTLEPVALTVTDVLPLDADGDDAAPPVAATPDGACLFVLLPAAGHRTTLQRLDATTGAAGPAIALPREALGGLLATDERVYVPDALGHGLWVIDQQTGRLLGTVAADKGLLAITTGGAAPEGAPFGGTSSSRQASENAT